MWTVDSWQLVAVVAGEGCVSPYLSYLSPPSPGGGGPLLPCPAPVTGVCHSVCSVCGDPGTSVPHQSLASLDKYCIDNLWSLIKTGMAVLWNSPHHFLQRWKAWTTWMFSIYFRGEEFENLFYQRIRSFGIGTKMMKENCKYFFVLHNEIWPWGALFPLSASLGSSRAVRRCLALILAPEMRVRMETVLPPCPSLVTPGCIWQVAT